MSIERQIWEAQAVTPFGPLKMNQSSSCAHHHPRKHHSSSYFPFPLDQMDIQMKARDKKSPPPISSINHPPPQLPVLTRVSYHAHPRPHANHAYPAAILSHLDTHIHRKSILDRCQSQTQILSRKPRLRSLTTARITRSGNIHLMRSSRQMCRIAQFRAIAVL